MGSYAKDQRYDTKSIISLTERIDEALNKLTQRQMELEERMERQSAALDEAKMQNVNAQTLNQQSFGADIIRSQLRAS